LGGLIARNRGIAIGNRCPRRQADPAVVGVGRCRLKAEVESGVVSKDAKPIPTPENLYLKRLAPIRASFA